MQRFQFGVIIRHKQKSKAQISIFSRFSLLRLELRQIDK